MLVKLAGGILLSLRSSRCFSPRSFSPCQPPQPWTRQGKPQGWRSLRGCPCWVFRRGRSWPRRSRAGRWRPCQGGRTLRDRSRSRLRSGHPEIRGRGASGRGVVSIIALAVASLQPSAFRSSPFPCTYFLRPSVQRPRRSPCWPPTARTP